MCAREGTRVVRAAPPLAAGRLIDGAIIATLLALREFLGADLAWSATPPAGCRPSAA
jgi:hypothetical protein